jgi:transcriptional regulator with GAF, ATPase, and Fis domain
MFIPPRRILGRCPAWVEQLALVERSSSLGLTQLVQGDSGTGKELVAEFAHRTRGERCRKCDGAGCEACDGWGWVNGRPFVTVNCAAIPKHLVDSELFGHKKGSFTGATADRKGYFEQAHKGTLFLDEIGDLAIDAQAKLLRALQNKEVRPVGGDRAIIVNTAIVAATNRDLEAMVEQGTFRGDLYFRLVNDGAIVHLPPLHERGAADVAELARWCLDQKPAYQGLELPDETVKALAAREWRHGIRELSSVVCRAALVALTRGETAIRVTAPSQPVLAERPPERPATAGRWATKREACAFYGLSEDTLLRRANRGDIQSRGRTRDREYLLEGDDDLSRSARN